MTKDINLQNDSRIFQFFISHTALLSSKVIAIKHYTGEIIRDKIKNISITEEVNHLGFQVVETEKYIDAHNTHLLKMTPNFPVNSMLTFYKRIKPLCEFILTLTSFAERRRLSWYKCQSNIGCDFYEIYHSRTKFYDDKPTTLLIGRFSFEDFLKSTLRNITNDNMLYITHLIKAYLSGMDFSMHSKIVLWDSLLEKVLKKRFNKKKKDLKKELLQKIPIVISDLSPIEDLIDTRNAIAHGDIHVVLNMQHFSDWQILIERVLLSELQWNNLSVTDVSINGIKPYDL